MLDIQAGANEAVVFFKGDLVDKEVRFAEFEAVLDGFAGLPAYAGKVVRAVYLQINRQLVIQSAVFFTLPFTDDGQVEPTWNIPLQHLADHGLPGPDLGDGTIRLACRSSCPVVWYKDKLWDPEMGARSTFDLLVEAVKRNRLGLIEERLPEARPAPAQPVVVSEVSSPRGSPDTSASVPVGPHFNRKYRRRLIGLKQKHSLELRTLTERLRRRVESTEAAYFERLQKKDAALQELKNRLAKARREELKLKEALDGYESKFNKIRERYEETLRKDNSEYAAELSVLREQFQVDLSEKLQAQAEELNERIAMRETELHYRDEQLSKLRDELALTKKELQSLMKSDSGQILQRMTDSGITFVAYHPGIEHLVLVPAEITVYVNDPIAFVAQRCGVTDEEYREWLMHYRLPVCRHKDVDGQVCGQPIEKVMKPAFFRHGESDRCGEHRGERDLVDSSSTRDSVH